MAPTSAPPTSEPARPARGSTEACIGSHGTSQEFRAEKKFLEARAELLECSNPSCPGLIRGDCARWFDEVKDLIPSMIVAVRRSGLDVAGAEVELDGTPIAPGREVEVNPGAHQVVVRVPDQEPHAAQVQLSPGEQHRLVTIELPALPSELPLGGIAPEKKVPMHRPVPVVTWILGGAAVAFAGTGAVFGVMALSERDGLSRPQADGGCAPFCSEEQVSGLNTQSLIADIAFGAAILSAGGAALTYVFRPEVPIEDPSEEGARLRWSVTPEGAFVGYGGTF